MTGEDIREWRIRNGYQTQADLQKELGIKSRTTISAWENMNEPIPRPLELALIALERMPELRNYIGLRAKGRQHDKK